MKKRNKEIILNVIGFVLIAFFVFRLVCLIRDDMFVDILWLCNHVPLILGIAVLYRSSFWITAEISFLFFGAIGWIIDYLSKVIFDFHIFGSTDYLFPVANTEFFIVTSIIHLCTIPLGIISLFLIKKSVKGSWKGAILHGLILFPFAYLAGRENNINCLFESCTPNLFEIPFYSIVSVLGYFAFFVIPLSKFLEFLLSKKKFPFFRVELYPSNE